MSSSEGSRREKRSSSDQSAKVTSEEKIKGGTISKVLKFFGKGGLVSPIVRRRRMVTALVLGFLGTNFFMFLRFFFFFN